MDLDLEGHLLLTKLCLPPTTNENLDLTKGPSKLHPDTKCDVASVNAKTSESTHCLPCD